MADDQVLCWKCPTGQLQLVIGSRRDAHVRCDVCQATHDLDDPELAREVTEQRYTAKVASAITADDLQPATIRAARRVAGHQEGGG